MINLVAFSGGKDSTALVLWAYEKLKDFQIVFCDTGWEHPLTYKYLKYVVGWIDGFLCLAPSKGVWLKSNKYDGFEDLCIKRKRVPSLMARYCTEELKIFPMRDYIKSLDCKVNLFVGIRAEESARRARMSPSHWDETYQCRVYRPILRWTVKDVFDMHKKHGIEPNPLYKIGMKRVGCMPCIMASNKELAVIFKKFPDRVERIRELEREIGSSYFPAGDIPAWACTGEDKGVRFPWIDDFVKYLEKNPNQQEMFDQPSCMSYYGLCE